MKCCAVVPARPLSKVITTAPESPVPASSRSLLASSVSRNWGVFGLKKLRGMGLEGHRQRRPAMGAAHLQGGRNHRAVAEMDAVEIAHRHHRPPGDGGRGRGVADNGKVRRHFRGSSASRQQPGVGAGP